MNENTRDERDSGISRLQFLKTMGLGAAALASGSLASAHHESKAISASAASAPWLASAPGKAAAAASKPVAGGKGPRLAIKGVTYTGIWYNGPALTIPQIIERAKMYDYAGVEIDAKRPQAFPLDVDQKARKEIRNKLDETGIELAAVAAYNNFMEPIREYWEMNLITVREQLKLAKDLNAKTLRVFASWPMISSDEKGFGTMRNTRKWFTDRTATLSHEEQMDLTIQALKELAPFAEDVGVTMALQNHGPGIRSYKEVLEILDAVNSPNVKACIDLQNLQKGEDVRQAVLDTGSRQIHMHYNGEFRRRPDGRMECYNANADFHTYIKAMLEINYQGFLAYEFCFPCKQKDKDGNLISDELAGIERIHEQVQLGRDFMNQVIADARAELKAEGKLV